ncbi:hypothetical protein BN109_020 [Yersinia phage phi80-18]|uniref:Uncharacterized protein n=1 Tax=Yersinia phage phi80-18 TaxID=1206559 RepID=I7LHC7_9CAUD|nr:hypothetical protein BN109_020 [Yersinia phage phi80-18]CCI88859.2 hypothetical protein BN109_020 [Yersinia phage phi80-18]
MTKINSLIKLIKLNQDNDEGYGLDVLCGIVSCRGVDCDECPLNNKDSMKVLLSELESKNV